MKKILSFFLVLLLVVSLTACDQPSVDVDDNTIGVPEVTEEPEVTETVEEPAFDTSWASNDFEKLIPQPPFEGWTGTVESDNVYEMETSKANPAGTLDYYDTWTAYLQTLTDIGFTVDGDVYSSKATDSNGNSFKLKCGDGFAWITITVKK